MECKNHPGTNAFDHCAGCAESFCPNCLVEMAGVKYCGSCKVLPLRGRPIRLEAALTPCKEAEAALTWSLAGILFFPLILELVAISKALTAKKLIADNPRLMGTGKANAVLIIAIARLVVEPVILLSFAGML